MVVCERHMFMYRMVLVLLVLTGTVRLGQAEWTEVSQATSSESTVYVDPATQHIDEKRGLVKIWVLYDFPELQKMTKRRSYSSVRAREQFDCKEERMRTLAWSYFKGNMAQQEVVLSESNELGEWQPITPSSIDESLWEWVCDTPQH